MKKILSRLRMVIRGEKGLTLTEILVATTIFVIAAAVAFVIYNLSRESFKKGEMAADQQQSTRVAFDELCTDLRLAGYNTNPMGSPVLPDEQIEGAWDTTITVRGDYDHEDPSLNSTPESSLAVTFSTITTGNDEIVTYALGKEGWTGGSSIKIYADVADSTRDGTVEEVTIDHVALMQDAPPYVLYKITLNNDYATYGTSSFIVRQPVADNIKSMTFKYYDQNGALMTAPGGSESAKDTRSTIRRIEVDLVGMTQHPDPKWVDPADSDPKTRQYRKFNLTSDIIPRNLGMKGIPDIDLTAPSTPTGVALCQGHCEGMIVKWNANDPNEIVDHYMVKFGTSPGSMDDVRETRNTYIFISNLMTGTLYYFAVAAVDASGNRSQYSSAISAVVKDDVSPTRTVPAAVDSGSATITGHDPSEGLVGRIQLSWNAVSQNADPLACDPGSPTIRDLKGYRIYRSTSSSYTPGPSYLLADENTVLASASPQYTDWNVVNCRNYYYNITAVDKCGNESAPWAAAIQGKASSAIQPAKPTNVNANRIGPDRIRITWTPVTQDTATPPNTIFIDNYKIWKARIPTGSNPWMAEYTYIGNSSTSEYIDTGAEGQSEDWEIYYRVSALDDCPNESDLSDPALSSCPFDGEISIDPPDGSEMATGTYTITVSVSGTDTYTSCNLQIVDQNNQTVYNEDRPGSPPYTFSWTVTIPGNYYVTATVENSSGCIKTKTVTYNVVPTVPCEITASDPVYNPTKGASKYNSIWWKIANSSGKDLEIFKLVVRLAEDRTQKGKKLQKIYYPWVEGLSFDQQPNVVYSSSGDTLPASVSFNNDPRPPLPLGAEYTALNPQKMGLLFDKPLIVGQLKDIVEVVYTFRYHGEPSQGECDLRIEPIPE
ncbi:MAG: prepilin-type N-terminal cleavage/methylation domain-containing protein [Acidobacteriota bacterium]